ncbi:MAG: winged helix-turn-helix transcriptional regulator [Rhodobacteraceae bacterium]|nr:winged helix-turn-helix transcriptional regulator [Paracoccaceae bacterium]
MQAPDFDLVDFLPYLLNQAAEQTSIGFQASYKARYGLLRTEWRVIFHLGRYGEMTAKDICARARLHKTKVSRAVKALETRRYLTRSELPHDRRNEILRLTRLGQSVFAELNLSARHFDETVAKTFTAEENRILRHCLRKLAGF